MEAETQPHTDEDIPSSSSEDGFDSLAPAPVSKEPPKNHAAATVEPPPLKEDWSMNDVNEGGEIAGKAYASAITKPPPGRRRGTGGEPCHDDKEHREPISPQKTGETSTSSNGHETNDRASKKGKGRLVSGDYANNRRFVFHLKVRVRHI